MRVEYHPAVEPELRDIKRYYDERVPGLGSEFIDEFERQMLSIAATLLRWAVVGSGIRRCLMRRFPYVIYFRHVSEDFIRITVVRHHRRHPGYGDGRR